MVVSTRAGTVVEVLPLPAPVPRLSWVFPAGLAASLSADRFLEELQSLPRRKPGQAFADLDPNRFAGRNEADLMSRPNPVPIGKGLGYRHLELARDLRHAILTLARIISLRQPRCHNGRPRGVAQR